MSTAAPPPLAIAAAATTGVGLGYGIAIAVSILVLISTIMLASYACVRIKANGRRIVGRGTYGGGGGGGDGDSDSDSDGSSHQQTASNSGGPVVVVMGLERPMIEAYPKIVLGESRRLPKPNNGPCAICLCEYVPRDTIRCVPQCHHCFHAVCVDEWLRMSATCPLCRNSPVPSAAPTPVATPLSDLVPLAFHAR